MRKNHDAVEASRELCVVATNRDFDDGDTKNAKKIQSFRRDYKSRYDTFSEAPELDKLYRR